jgi:gliding motility-associated-like protein
MKKYLLIFALSLPFFCEAQVYDADSLNSLKKQNKLSGTEQFINPNGGTTQFKTAKKNKSKFNQSVASTTCQCWITRDTSFSIVPFDGSGGSGGPGTPPNYDNDDWSTNPITLPFNFCLYGSTYNQIYINNNGNVSIGAPYSVFSAVPFPSSSYIMIAPFWGDVDTRGVGSGYVHYKLTPTALIVQWDSVGYYGMHVDKLNTFQLILTDGNDPIIQTGNNISFCYGDMQWTTGDASGGSGGFGGTPATVGVNKGDGINYAQISLFDHAGTVYTNPAGSPTSGVDWLDNKSFVFNCCGTGTNLPPIASGVSLCSDTITICHAGDTLIYTTNFTAPEVGQSVTCTGSGGSLPAGYFSVLSTTSGISASITFMVATGTLTPGYYNVSVTGTDNGTPPLSTTVNYVIHILNSSAPVPNVVLSPNPACLSQHPTVTLTNCSLFDTHTWSNGDTACSFPVTTTDTLYLTVTKTGCYISQIKYIKVSPDPVATIGGVLSYCPPSTGTTVYVNQPIPVGTSPFTYSWDGGVATTDTLHNVVSGTHSVIVTDANGCKDTVSVLVNASSASLSITATGNLCAGTVTLTPSITTGISYSWSPSSATTQTISVSTAGIYTCTVVANSCTVVATYTVSAPTPPTVGITGDTSLCPSQISVLTATASPAGSYTYHWYNGSTSLGSLSTQTVNAAGTSYHLVGINNSTLCKDSITFFVNMYGNPLVNITGNSTICAGKNDLLTANPSGGNPLYTYSWTPGSATTQTTNVTAAGDYTVRVTDAKGCTNLSHMIVKLSNPKITVTKNTYICPGKIASIHVSGSGTPMISYQWVSAPSAGQTFTTATAGAYEVFMTDAYGCTDTAIANVIYNPVPQAIISYSPGNPIELGTAIAFSDNSTVTTGSVVADSWTFGDTAIANNNFHPSHTYAAGGHYPVTLIVTSDKGCKDTTVIYIDIQWPIVIPNIITPNGDGINEFLEFKNLLYFKNNKLLIYNRWGTLLYQSDDYKNNWTGKDYVDGTYYFILDVPDKKRTIRGFFTNIR